MNKYRIHTTEGVRDYYGSEFTDRRTISDRIFSQMLSYGYEGVDTPVFEYFDLFAGELSETSAKDFYKFFDKEGDTLVLRPDFTPSMARCAGKYFLESGDPVRICYSGKAYMNSSSLQGKLNEYTQTGAELIQFEGVYADAEIIALLVSCLKAAGLERFQISIGDAGYFTGLCEEAGLDDIVKEELREQISGKNYFAAEKLLTEAGVDPQSRDRLLRVSSFLGSEEDLIAAEQDVSHPDAKEALRRLCSLHRVLKLYHVDSYVSYDLGMIHRFHYYTGVIFKAFTYGAGDAIASGGRYDRLLEKFYKKAPAIGFAINLDDLMNALYRQKIAISAHADPETLQFTPGTFADTLKKAQELRENGQNVRLNP